MYNSAVLRQKTFVSNQMMDNQLFSGLSSDMDVACYSSTW